MDNTSQPDKFKEYKLFARSRTLISKSIEISSKKILDNPSFCKGQLLLIISNIEFIFPVDIFTLTKVNSSNCLSAANLPKILESSTKDSFPISAPVIDKFRIDSDSRIPARTESKFSSVRPLFIRTTFLSVIRS